jgi:hypothetical protein
MTARKSLSGARSNVLGSVPSAGAEEVPSDIATAA